MSEISQVHFDRIKRRLPICSEDALWGALDAACITVKEPEFVARLVDLSAPTHFYLIAGNRYTVTSSPGDAATFGSREEAAMTALERIEGTGYALKCVEEV